MRTTDQLMIHFHSDGEVEFFPAADTDSKRLRKAFIEMLDFFRRHPEALEHIGHTCQSGCGKKGGEIVHVH